MLNEWLLIQDEFISGSLLCGLLELLLLVLSFKIVGKGRVTVYMRDLVEFLILERLGVVDDGVDL